MANSREPPTFRPNGKTPFFYARMTIGETAIMGSDVPPDHFQPIRRVYLSLSMESVKEADDVFALLSDEGQIFMPMQETFFALRSAMLRDKFGTSWMIIHERPPQ